MAYVSKNNLSDGRMKLMEANKFLTTEEGKNKELLRFINDGILHNDTLHYYRKNLQFYIFCLLIDWFIENQFLADKKGGERVLVASNLATKIYLDIVGGLK